MKHGHVFGEWLYLTAQLSSGHLQLLIALRKENRWGTWGLVMSPVSLTKWTKYSLFLSLCVHSWEGASYGIRLPRALWQPVWRGLETRGKRGRELTRGEGGTVRCPLWSGAALAWVPLSQSVWAALERLSLGLARGQELWPLHSHPCTM